MKVERKSSGMTVTAAARLTSAAGKWSPAAAMVGLRCGGGGGDWPGP